MLTQNLYGVVLDANAMFKKHNARVEPAPAPGPKTRYVAKIVGFREYKDFELVVPVIDKDGRLVGDPQFQVAVAWMNMESGRPNFSFDARYPIAETFSLPEMTEGAPIIHAGTGNDGPPYVVFLTDDDGEVVSEVAHVGWVENHITFCPIFQVIDLKAPQAPTGTGGTVDMAALAREVVRHLVISVQAV